MKFSGWSAFLFSMSSRNKWPFLSIGKLLGNCVRFHACENNLWNDLCILKHQENTCFDLFELAHTPYRKMSTFNIHACTVCCIQYSFSYWIFVYNLCFHQRWSIEEAKRTFAFTMVINLEILKFHSRFCYIEFTFTFHHTIARLFIPFVSHLFNVNSCLVWYYYSDQLFKKLYIRIIFKMYKLFKLFVYRDFVFSIHGQRNGRKY